MITCARCRLVVLFVILACVAGCGPFDASVTGTLTLDGSPLDRGTVIFYPEGNGATAYAQVREDGSFSARVGDEDGLPSGGYMVGVRVVEVIPPKVEGDPPGFKNIIPPRYKSPQTSGLRFDIAKGSNEIQIDLESQ